MSLVPANGVELEAWVSRARTDAPGPAPVVVGLHGLVLDDLSGFYFTLGGPLSEVADLVLYDLRGHGRSAFVPTGYTVATMVEDLFALLDHIGHRGPVHLVGNSYGGAVALSAAARRPERVASVVMVEGHYPVEGWGVEMEATMALVATRLTPEYVMEQLHLTSRRKAARIAARADQLINHSSLRPDLLAEPVLGGDALAAVACPVLCLYGSESDLAARGRRLAASLGEAELIEFAGATHSLLTERTAELRPLVRDWVLRHHAGAAAGAAGRVGAR